MSNNDEVTEYKFKTTMKNGKTSEFTVQGELAMIETLNMEKRTSTVEKVEVNGKVKFKR